MEHLVMLSSSFPCCLVPLRPKCLPSKVLSIVFPRPMNFKTAPLLTVKSSCLFSFYPEFAHDAGPLTNVKLKNVNLLWRRKAGTSF